MSLSILGGVPVYMTIIGIVSAKRDLTHDFFKIQIIF